MMEISGEPLDFDDSSGILYGGGHMGYKPPSKLEILGLTYDVILREFPKGDEISQVGSSDALKQEIQLDPRLKDEAMAQTLWHEVVHSILDGLSQGDLVQDEPLVQGLAIALNGLVGPIEADS